MLPLTSVQTCQNYAPVGSDRSSCVSHCLHRCKLSVNLLWPAQALITMSAQRAAFNLALNSLMSLPPCPVINVPDQEWCGRVHLTPQSPFPGIVWELLPPAPVVLQETAPWFMLWDCQVQHTGCHLCGWAQNLSALLIHDTFLSVPENSCFRFGNTCT